MATHVLNVNFSSQYQPKKRKTLNRMMSVSCSWRGFPPNILSPTGGHWIRYPCFPFQSCLNKKCCIWQKNSITACPWYVISRQSEERWITKSKIKYWFLKWKSFTTLETELPKVQAEDSLNKNCTSTALKVAIWCLLHSREAGWGI